MTRSVYVIGGAGTGKSTFTSNLIGQMGLEFGALEDLHSLRNAKALVTLRGHKLFSDEGEGLYLGVMRPSFPGSDGLDRASSPTGEAWLQKGERLPEFIITEGATLATRRFMSALHEHTDLLLVHLEADPETVEQRCAERGSNQKPGFVLATRTRSANLLADMAKVGVRSMQVDTEDPTTVDIALGLCEDHLR